MAANFPAVGDRSDDFIIIVDVRIGQNDFLHALILRRIAELCGLSSRLEFVIAEEADTRKLEIIDKLQYVRWDNLLLIVEPDSDTLRVDCFKRHAAPDSGFKPYASKFKDLFQPSSNELREQLTQDWSEFFDRIRAKPIADDFQEFINGICTRYESLVAERIETLA